MRNKSKRVRRSMALLLSACLMAAEVPFTGYAEVEDTEEIIIREIAPLDQSIEYQKVLVGTGLEHESRLLFPDELQAKGYKGWEMPVASGSDAEEEDQELKDIVIQGVTWESDMIYNEMEEGEYVFTAQIPDRYILAYDDIEIPEITVEFVEEIADTASPSNGEEIDSITGSHTLENDINSIDNVRQVKDLIDGLPTADEIYESMVGDSDPGYGQWLENMKAVLGDIDAAWQAFEALTEEELQKISEDQANKLFELKTLADRLAEMAEFATGDNWIDHAASGFAGGNGTKEDPYQIANGEQLAYLSSQAKKDYAGNVTKGKYYELTQTIDLSGYEWTPVTMFKGNFDGQFYEISGMTCKKGVNGAGLFGTIDGSDFEDALEIRDVVMTGCKVEEETARDVEYGAGILAGKVSMGVNLTGCSVSGSSVVTLGNNLVPAGGLVGYLGYSGSTRNRENKVVNCSVSDVSVKNSSGQVGGLFGNAWYTVREIRDCTAENVTIETKGVVNNGARAGGLIGYLIMGYIPCRVENCSVTGNSSVSAYDEKYGYSVGGLVGAINFGSGRKDKIQLTNCYSEADVFSENTENGGIGGLVGLANSANNYNNFVYFSIDNCYSTGKVTAKTSKVGGLVGTMQGMISDSWASGDVEGNYQVGGLIGYFENYGTPAGEINHCYATGNVTGVAMNGVSAEAIGGLLGFGSGIIIKSSYAEGDVNGQSSCIGGLVGTSESIQMEECYAAGDITGADWQVGGLIGYAYQSSITDCYCLGNVHFAPDNPLDFSEDRIGGFIGETIGSTIKDSYFAGTVESNLEDSDTIGALVGYSTDDMIIENCYYDKGVSGLENGLGYFESENTIEILGYSTEQMKHPNLAYELNEEGSREIWTWKKTENENYPYLGSPAINRKVSTDSKLASLILSDGSLSPVFAPETDRYTAETENETILITVQKPSGAVTTIRSGQGQEIQFSEPISRNLEIGANDFTIKVTAEDQMSVKEYHLTITRKPSQSGGEVITSSVVEVKEGAPQLEVEGLNELLEEIAERDDQGITQSDLNLIQAGGGSVELKVVIEKRDETKDPADLKPLIRKIQNSARPVEVWGYFDLSVIKTIKDSEGSVIRSSYLTELPRTVSMIITLPEELRGKKGIVVYRMHDGKAELLPEGNGTESYQVIGENVIIKALKYSAYAIGFYSGTVDRSASDGSDEEQPGTWIQDQTGWWYRYANGTWPSGGWYLLEWDHAYNWYHFNSAGYIDTGWFTDLDGRTYYLHPDHDGNQGQMETGWKMIDGVWYYFETRRGYWQGMMYRDRA